MSFLKSHRKPHGSSYKPWVLVIAEQKVIACYKNVYYICSNKNDKQ